MCQAMRQVVATKILEAGLEESLSYRSFPREHWIRISTNNAVERLNREMRRRLVAARLRHVAATQWGIRRYLDMDRFNNLNPTRDE
jgi:transposase-like protein